MKNMQRLWSHFEKDYTLTLKDIAILKRCLRFPLTFIGHIIFLVYIQMVLNSTNYAKTYALLPLIFVITTFETKFSQ